MGSIEDELTRAQKVAADLEGLVAQLNFQNQLASEKLAKIKEEHDAIVDKSVKLELSNADLRVREVHSKKMAVEEFKYSKDF